MINSRPVAEYNVEDHALRFLLNTQLTATFCITTCNLHSSGCYSFGTNLANELKIDYLDIQVDESVRPIKINFIKEKIDSKQYQNVIITGCFFDSHLPFLETQKKYSLTQLKQIYIITPPWLIMGNEEYKAELSSIVKKYASVNSCKITLLTSGIETVPGFNIGLPSPFPPLSLNNERKFNIPNCYGLIYIRELFSLNIFKQSKTFTTQYLSAYFSQISLISSNKSTDTPAVIAIVSTNQEATIIKQEAKKFNVNIIVCNRVSPEDYVLALKTIGMNGGFIASNGAHSTIQAILSKCNVLFYGNKEINATFVTQLVETIPCELKNIAKVILGLSDKFNLLKNTAAIETIRDILEANMQKNYNNFKKLKETYIKVLPLLRPATIQPTTTQCEMKLLKIPLPCFGKRPRSRSHEGFFYKVSLEKPKLSFGDSNAHHHYKK
jgi:hypothetical protein